MLGSVGTLGFQAYQSFCFFVKATKIRTAILDPEHFIYSRFRILIW